ncbi:MAG: M14 metallopeptidase family protein [Bacteroidota bacterium]
MSRVITIFFILIVNNAIAQDYFYGTKGPFDSKIPSPEKFLGYEIGNHHTRHDRIVAYMQELARLSDRASIVQYGMTNEYRPLIILAITTPEHQSNLESLRQKHLEVCDPDKNVTDFSSLPVFVNLGYNVHGNEPSGGEASMLTAYTLVASQSDEVKKYLENAVIFVDPTINPDGRDRHTHWANMYKGTPMVADPQDAEHNEYWPRGRTNHYWFDLNRDWLLGINPESRGKLNWYHQWYPNVVTDFHEMGTNSTYFFEPMKANGSKDPIMPRENYEDLNNTFGEYFSKDLDAIGSLYFSKEVFDGTYPGYGSSYPDIQGGLGLLFEQASSRGHVQETPMGKITFAFTIRNQYISSLATVRAAVENKKILYNYQREFFKSAISRANKSSIKGYVFGDPYDQNRNKAFIDKLLLHKIEVFKLKTSITKNGKVFKPNYSYIVPTRQDQYRMVQTMFETYKNYTDSVFYDASGWSVANFYNIPYTSLTGSLNTGDKITNLDNLTAVGEVEKSDYAYLIDWDDYMAPAVLYYLQEHDVRLMSGFKPFTIATNQGNKDFGYGTLLIPVSKQKISSDSLFNLLQAASAEHKVEISSVKGGYSLKGIDLGSSSFRPLKKPKAIMLVGDGTSSYEAGEVWHLLDTRVGMPITKVPMRNFSRANLNDYTVMVMISGNYSRLDSAQRQRIKNWANAGNTLVTIRQASEWLINNKLVKETLVKKEKDKKKKEQEKNEENVVNRKSYVDSRENIGKESVGGAIFNVDLDLTHPLAFGYRNRTLPVYRNSTVWLSPSKNEYSTVAKYTKNPHVDGFITEKNLNEYLKPSASLIVSPMGTGRAVMFADNPNFRGSWYGTNRLFLNAIFLGQHISIPRSR